MLSLFGLRVQVGEPSSNPSVAATVGLSEGELGS